MKHKPGNAYLIKIGGKKEIALFLEVDNVIREHKANNRFTYSHWNFKSSNLQSNSFFHNIEYSKAATILFGFDYEKS